jgi:ribosome maturation factor RimP
MIKKEQIFDLIDPKLKADGYFPVDVSVKSGNRIEVLIDSDQGAPIEYCVEISRLIEQSLDREAEDFELEVSSPGIGQPFKVKEQYLKSIERPVEVIMPDGKTQKGILEEVGDEDFVVKEEKKVKVEGKKKKELQVNHHRFRFDEVNKVKEILKL